MAYLPEADWIGQKDHKGREIVYWQKIVTESFYQPKLAILLTPTGNLEIMLLKNIIEITVSKEITTAFVGIPSMGFSLKGGGRTYFDTGDRSGTSLKFQMDYDSHGNLFTRMIRGNFKSSPVLFLSRFWVFIIKRKQRIARKEYKLLGD